MPGTGTGLIEICHALFDPDIHDARRKFGVPDDLKLKSSMTIFASVPDTNPVFGTAPDRFFKGSKDHRTLEILEGQ